MVSAALLYESARQIQGNIHVRIGSQEPAGSNLDEVMDARKIVGWSMKPTLARELVPDALLMALWRRKPKQRMHSDQGPQYGSEDWTLSASA